MSELVVGTCVGPACGAVLIPQVVWNRKPDLRGRYRQHLAHGMCGPCYNRARRVGTLPDPAPLPVPLPPKPDVRLTARRAIARLDAIDVGEDPEKARDLAEGVLLEYLVYDSPKVAAAFLAVAARVREQRGAA